MLPAEALGALTEALDYPMFVVTAAGGSARAGCLVGGSRPSARSTPPGSSSACRAGATPAGWPPTPSCSPSTSWAGTSGRSPSCSAETADDVDKLARCAWTEGPSGSPLLDDCASRFVGRVVDRFDDHLAFVLEVVDAWSTGARPLLTFQSVRDLDPGHQA